MKPSARRVLERPVVLCECGCGLPAPIAQRNCRRRGYVRGEPCRFRMGHWAKAVRKPDYVVEDRGYSTPCWVWDKVLNSGGYGQAYVPGVGMCLAYKVYFERIHGPVPQGLQLDHLCRVRACVNPDHLEPVTRLENVRRGRHVRLSVELAREILASPESTRGLARRLGVHVATVGDVRRRRTWREVRP